MGGFLVGASFVSLIAAVLAESQKAAN